MRSYEVSTYEQKEIKNTIQNFLDNTLPASETVKSFEVVVMAEIVGSEAKWVYRIFFLAE